MNTRAIGVFDSGLGGLTTVKKLAQLLPGEDIIYLGDTGRVPYGSRSRETIIRYARQDAAFLAGFDIKAMVIACNTVSSAAPGVIAAEYSIPVFEVVNAPAVAAVSSTKNGRIGVIGTAATIRSGAYERAVKEAAPEFTVLSKSCPLFVPLVENGRVREDDVVALTVAEEYLAPLREAMVDTLILGCTHYPLLRGVIGRVMGSAVRLIDSGAETAKLVARELGGLGLLTPKETGGTAQYFVTDSTEGFTELASLFLESDVSGRVEQITLE